MVNTICEFCNIEFKCDNTKQKCCSRSCSSKLQHKQRPDIIDRMNKLKIGTQSADYVSKKKQHIDRSSLPKDKTCEICKALHDGIYGTGRFCSQSCRNTRKLSKETKEKISKTLNDKYKDREPIVLFCYYCGENFTPKNNNKTQRCCSISCASSLKLIENPEKSTRFYRTGMGKRSKNEIYFAELCQKYFGADKVVTNEKMFDGWDADVIIPDKKVAVAWNGIWHYQKITEKHSLKQVQSRDRIKEKIVTNHGYTFVVIKDMGKHNKKFVDDKFQEFITDTLQNLSIKDHTESTVDTQPSVETQSIHSAE